jgi:hypothetical protein
MRSRKGQFICLGKLFLLSYKELMGSSCLQNYRPAFPSSSCHWKKICPVPPTFCCRITKVPTCCQAYKNRRVVVLSLFHSATVSVARAHGQMISSGTRRWKFLNIWIHTGHRKRSTVQLYFPPVSTAAAMKPGQSQKKQWDQQSYSNPIIEYQK